MAGHAKVTITGSFRAGNIRPTGSRIVQETAREVEGEAKLLIQNPPKTGHIYELGEHQVNFTTKTGKGVSFTANKGRRSILHQASAPGEAPATDTSALSNSIETKDETDLQSIVNVNAKYGLALEYGTAHILPRPFMRPAVERVRAKFFQRLKDLFR
jgi:HK97 gp10 family phage protein